MFSAFVLDIRLKVILALTIISLVQQRLERCFLLTKKQSDPVETSVTDTVLFLLEFFKQSIFFMALMVSLVNVQHILLHPF